jgi:hypothetical protein
MAARKAKTKAKATAKPRGRAKPKPRAAASAKPRGRAKPKAKAKPRAKATAKRRANPGLVKGVKATPRVQWRPSRKVAEADIARGLGEYRKTHWGHRGKPDRILEADVADTSKPGAFVMLGELVSVAYRTTKAGDPPNCVYEHTFERPYPILAYSRDRLLVIAGGKYTISKRGIVG